MGFLSPDGDAMLASAAPLQSSRPQVGASFQHLTQKELLLKGLALSAPPPENLRIF
jgi:hypothetical protein